MKTTLHHILSAPERVALLIGNGINRYGGDRHGSSWERLLGTLAKTRGVSIDAAQAKEMSNTEFFDILDLARARDDKTSLQREFCDLMRAWAPRQHHRTIVAWAQRRSSPIITVNFDENLSKAVEAEYFGPSKGFTDYYPWRSYFGHAAIDDPKTGFGIWHAHGMMRYARSIRLGLTHYMGAVERARTMLYGKGGLKLQARQWDGRWNGSDSWLEVFLFMPLVIVGFGFKKDETFLRWLLLERARFHKIRPEWAQPTWYVCEASSDNALHRTFFEALGITMVIVNSHHDIYEAAAWQA